MIRWLVGAIGLGLVATHALAADPAEIDIGYLGQANLKSRLSLIEQPSDNDGMAGGRLAVEDNYTEFLAADATSHAVTRYLLAARAQF